MIDPVFLKRVVLKNYKSIKECSVKLGPLTFLLGQNGAGKSNFLDALRLVAESLNTSLEHALRDRGDRNAFPCFYRESSRLSGVRPGVYLPKN